MDKWIFTKAYIQDVADAIREKLSVDTTYKPAQMGDAIRSIDIIDDKDISGFVHKINGTPVGDNTVNRTLTPSGTSVNCLIINFITED